MWPFVSGFLSVLGFIDTVVCISTSFLSPNSAVWIYHSSTAGHLGCFYFWTIKNRATANIHESFCVVMFLFILLIHPGAELLGCMVNI
jgi:hypothetical protein